MFNNKKLDKLLRMGELTMKKLDDLVALEKEQINQIVNLNAALDGYRDLVIKINDELVLLKSGDAVPPSVEAKIDELLALSATQTAEIDKISEETFPPTP